jgi:ribosomal-protein-alanine N-acetyltransferase
LEISSRRLKLLAATVQTVEAEGQGPGRLAALIGARVPNDWPPETLRDALPLFRRWHEAHPDWIGWLDWYAVRLDLEAPVLCGSAGFHGPPDERSTVEVGYSVLPAHQRLGLATEMVGALVSWARSQPGVKGIEAETTADNVPSIRVLEPTGFRLIGPGPGPGSLRYRLP